jgi:hypothetical protein
MGASVQDRPAGPPGQIETRVLIDGTDAGFWKAQVGRGHAQRARIETFLQHTLTLLTKNIVSATHLYAAYRDYSQSGTGGTALDRLQKFQKYGGIYKRLQGEYPEPRINTFSSD